MIILKVLQGSLCSMLGFQCREVPNDIMYFQEYFFCKLVCTIDNINTKLITEDYTLRKCYTLHWNWTLEWYASETLQIVKKHCRKIRLVKIDNHPYIKHINILLLPEIFLFISHVVSSHFSLKFRMTMVHWMTIKLCNSSHGLQLIHYTTIPSSHKCLTRNSLQEVYELTCAIFVSK